MVVDADPVDRQPDQQRDDRRGAAHEGGEQEREADRPSIRAQESQEPREKPHSHSTLLCEVPVTWWIKVAGTGEAGYTQERWNERRKRMRAEGSGPSLFPKRPRIGAGDRLVVYASGSAMQYGEARFVAIEEVLSEEPEPSGHGRWPWRLRTRLVLAIDDLARAPALREIGVSPKTPRQHPHHPPTKGPGAAPPRPFRAGGGG